MLGAGKAHVLGLAGWCLGNRDLEHFPDQDPQATGDSQEQPGPRRHQWQQHSSKLGHTERYGHLPKVTNSEHVEEQGDRSQPAPDSAPAWALLCLSSVWDLGNLACSWPGPASLNLPVSASLSAPIPRPLPCLHSRQEPGCFWGISDGFVVLQFYERNSWLFGLAVHTGFPGAFEHARAPGRRGGHGLGTAAQALLGCPDPKAWPWFEAWLCSRLQLSAGACPGM